MADSRTTPVIDGQWFIPRLDPTKPPLPPPWYGGASLFTYGINPKIKEPLGTVPLSYKFSSPFVDGEVLDSYYTYTLSSRDVRGLAISQDLTEIQDYPPTSHWTSRLPFDSRPIDGYLSKNNYGFCVYALRTYEGLNTTEQSQIVVQGLDVASGGKTLTKQDFALQCRPQWYSSYLGGNVTPALGGFSMHEVDASVLTDEESYNLVRKRVVVLCNDVSNGNQKPQTPNGGAGYLLSTDPSLQFSVSGDGRYWKYFHPTRYVYPSASGTSFFKYYTDGGYTHTLCFVGEFSLKQFHDYITETENFFYIFNAASQPVFATAFDPMHYAFFGHSKNPNTDAGKTGMMFTYGTRTADGDKDLVTNKPPNTMDYIDYKSLYFSNIAKYDPAYSSDPTYIAKGTHFMFFDVGKAGDAAYTVDSYYHQVTLMAHPNMVTNGTLATPKESKQGIFDWKYLGTGKIDAYTFDGAAPTPYKPVYILERNTGRMIRETVSDKNGRYVVHALPTGIEYIAVSVDPKKTMNSAIEEFGAL